MLAQKPQSSLSVPLAEGCIRVGPVMHLAQLMAGLKVDLEPVLAQLGLTPQLFADAQNTLPIWQLGELLERCAESCACPHVGLLLGQSMQLAGFGLLGEILPHCSDVRTALTYVQDYFHLHDRAGMSTCTIEGDTVVFGYVLLVGPFAGSDQVQDAVLAMGLTIMRSLCGPRWRPRSALLSRRRPVDLRPYQQLLACPLDTNAESTSLAFPVGDLDLPVAGTDPGRFRLLNERLARVPDHHSLGFLDKVRRVVHAQVVLRNCTVSEVAKCFAMSRRSLNRRLESEGNSIRQIADEVRCSLASRLLADTDLSVGQIAAILDYSYPSAFNHAFERWHGMSPQHWRRSRGTAQA